MLELKEENSIGAKSDISIVSEKCEGMRETLEDYMLSLYGVCEGSKLNYKSQVRTFGRFLKSQGIKRFEDASSKDIDLFLSNYQKDSTKNVHIVRLKHLYGTFLKMPNLVEHLKIEGIKDELKDKLVNTVLSKLEPVSR